MDDAIDLDVVCLDFGVDGNEEEGTEWSLGKVEADYENTHQFTVVLKKQSDSDPLGLDVRVLKKKQVIEVVKVKEEGLIVRWNAEVSNPLDRVRAGDCIREINGTQGVTQAMLGIVATQLALKLVIVRRHIEVTLTKGSSDELGVTVEPSLDSIAITHIQDTGLVRQWNEDHPQKAVQVGDSIVSANGVGGDQMLEVLKSSDVALNLVFARALA